ncbi:MAG: glycosyltransferase family 9 protein [Candidatus Eisenbacteria sp.]|nr:glycosyltransferase family 9 protein [Candidatus Eisenbacteria bacterium]
MRSLFREWFLNLVIRGARARYPSGVVALSETLRHPRGILLIPSESLADMVHALPVVRALRRAYPDTRISMLASSAASDLLADAPGLDEAILCYPLDPPSNWRAFRQIVSELRTRGFDTLFSLDHAHDSVKSLVGYLSGATARVSFRDGDGHGLYNVVVDAPTANPYVATRGLTLLRSVGIDVSGIGTGWLPTENERKIAGQLVHLRGLGQGGILVGLEAAGTLMEEPPEMARMGRVLQRAFGAKFVVFQEDPPAACWQRGEPTAVEGAEDLACRTVRDVLSILASCDIFLCRATNLLHFAVAMGVPTLASLPPTMPRSMVPPESARLKVISAEHFSEDELLGLVEILVPRLRSERSGERVREERP